MSDLDCDEFVELVTAYLDGALDEETQARVARHLSLCDGCETYLDQFRQTIRTLGDDRPGEGLPAEARAALLAKFRTRKN
ncbi:MAG TPA: zf-HC2 domain-containing protein [Streptosporangiaceae bacterium]